jgi:predicted O-methyltransferase YrrM
MNPVQVSERLQAYMEALLPERDPVLAALEREAERDSVPIVGPHEGMLLFLLTRAMGARRLLELGTATGYSGLWLIRGAGPKASLVTIELDRHRAARARRSFADGAPEAVVEVLEEDALGALDRLQGPFDLVFNDLLNSFSSEADVERAFRRSVDLVRVGGMLLADNALRQGEVADPRSQPSRNVAAYNRLAAADRRLEAVVVPIRDGLSIAVRSG